MTWQAIGPAHGWRWVAAGEDASFAEGARRSRGRAVGAAVLAAALVVLGWAAAAAPAGAEGRVALVIGNSANDHAGVLENPGNDAADVGATLGRLGFDVTPVRDAGTCPREPDCGPERKRRSIHRPPTTGGAPALDPTDERRLETEPRRGVRHRHSAKAAGNSNPLRLPPIAPVVDSTRMVSVPSDGRGGHRPGRPPRDCTADHGRQLQVGGREVEPGSGGRQQRELVVGAFRPYFPLRSNARRRRSPGVEAPGCRAHQHDRVLASVKARRLSVYHWLEWALGWPIPAAPLARRRWAGGGRTVRVAGRRGAVGQFGRHRLPESWMDT